MTSDNIEILLFLKTSPDESMIDALIQNIRDHPMDIQFEDQATDITNKFLGEDSESIFLHWKEDRPKPSRTMDMTIIISDAEKSDVKYLMQGIHQLEIELESAYSIFRDNPEISQKFLTLFGTFIDSFDPFLGIFGYEGSLPRFDWDPSLSSNSIKSLLSTMSEEYSWSTFYFDNELYNSIPSSSIKGWAIHDTAIGDSGHLISNGNLIIWSDEPQRDVELEVHQTKQEKRLFNEMILPHIRERFYIEFSEYF
jgi:hypothetical protein